MKKEILIPLLLIVLLIFFWAISLMVFINPRPNWVRYKLKMGGLILSLTFIASCGPSQTKCYDVAAIQDSVKSPDSLAINSIKNTETDSVAIVKPRKKKNNSISPEIINDTINNIGPTEPARCYMPPAD